MATIMKTLRNGLGQCQNFPRPLARPSVNLLAEQTSQQIPEELGPALYPAAFGLHAEDPESGFAH